MSHVGKKERFSRKALVLGRIGLVRSLGRAGIPVVMAREAANVFERASRYCEEFLLLPGLLESPEKAVQVLIDFGKRQDTRPVAFFNGESDVLLFSRHRDRLGKYFEIMLAANELIEALVCKHLFARLAEEAGLSVPETYVPQNRAECYDAAEEIGYPCIIKPITQQRWHDSEITNAIGFCKALLISSRDELDNALNRLPPIAGNEMLQQYIPGDDGQHFDFHAYIEQSGTPRGHLVLRKGRTYPIHFGMGCYVKYVEEPAITELCLDALQRIGYTGAANINLKRHPRTGKDYILEINPRFSISTILDWHCGVNLPYMQYCDAVGLPMPELATTGKPRRWLWFGADFKAMIAYRKCRELTPWQWLKSFFTDRGKIEFHVFAWDDPLPLPALWLFNLGNFIARGIGYLKRRLRFGKTEIREKAQNPKFAKP